MDKSESWSWATGGILMATFNLQHMGKPSRGQRTVRLRKVVSQALGRGDILFLAQGQALG